MNLSTNLGGGCHSSRGRGKIWICNFCTYLLFASVYLGIASADSEAIAPDDLAILEFDNGCLNPTHIGEIKLTDLGMVCLDVEGADGIGRVGHCDCDGYDDQKFKYCEDGTIRTMARSDYCLDRDGSTGLKMELCTINSAENNKSQQWTLSTFGTTFSVEGIEHVSYFIRNKESNECLRYKDVNGSKVAMLEYCIWGEKSSWYIFHNRGKVLFHGRLRNKGNGMWLYQKSDRENLEFAVEYRNGNEKFIRFEKSPVFSFYENGDLINEENGLCVRFRQNDASNVETRPCNLEHEKFEYIDRGDYGYFQHDSKGCMAANKSNPFVLHLTGRACEYDFFQTWEWVPKHWFKPKGKWRRLADKVTSFEVTYSTTNLDRHEETVADEISTEISAGFEIEGIGASTTVTSNVYTSVATSWEEEKGREITIIYDCVDNNGTYIMPNVLWQWDMTIDSVDKPDYPVTWEANSFYCSADDYYPICPARSKCANDDCTECERGVEANGKSFKEFHEKLQIGTDEL